MRDGRRRWRLLSLAVAKPATLVAVAEHLLDIERKNARRWFGFGGEVKALNAKAALLLGRTLRRADQRIGDDEELNRGDGADKPAHDRCDSYAPPHICSASGKVQD